MDASQLFLALCIGSFWGLAKAFAQLRKQWRLREAEKIRMLVTALEDAQDRFGPSYRLSELQDARASLTDLLRS